MIKPKKKIYLQEIGKINNKTSKNLEKGLKKRFEKFNLFIILAEEPLPLLESEYNEIRRQYDGSKILTRLFNHSKKEQYFRTLGVLDVDIYSSGLNFVFGIATPPNSKATRNFGVSIISMSRLKEEFYNKKKDENLFKERTLKEAVHELGHTLGLNHCDNYCIMRFSNYLAQTDEKPIEFCKSCTAKISRFIDDMNNKK